MRKVTFYLFFAASAVFLLYACTKSGSSTTIIGNWVNRFDFGGNERTEAVSFVVGDTAYVGTGYNSSLTTDPLYFANNGRFYDFWK